VKDLRGLPEEVLPKSRVMKAVVLNFCAVDYINSSGIDLLIRLVRQARDKSLTVPANDVSEHYQKIFQMVGLTIYFYSYPDFAILRVGLLGIRGRAVLTEGQVMAHLKRRRLLPISDKRCKLEEGKKSFA